MSDPFSLLDLPRRPWLSSEEVRAAFQRRAASLHPDAGGTADDFSALNAAYQTLRSPAARLRYLLGSGSAMPEVPAELFELFPRVAAVLRGAVSVEDIAEMQKAVAGEMARAEEQLRALDAAWPVRDGLAELQARCAILEKWAAQLREARLRLEIG
jgi:curved DNA-binding protein CbpA